MVAFLTMSFAYPFLMFISLCLICHPREYLLHTMVRYLIFYVHSFIPSSLTISSHPGYVRCEFI
ncbi:hypothetical protein DFP73DRAFT_541214 [Morchella snyderi]|nr:hypothetical protein DFP73DRAFT_541214 [Morchella snyderi]